MDIETESKTVLIASDHAGYEMKSELVPFLRDQGYSVEDMGPTTLNAEDDYPDYMHPLANRISNWPDKYVGVVIGGSGQGEAIVCNRYPGVRAAVYYGGNDEIVSLSRKHNDANVLSLGARFIDARQAKGALELWLRTDFDGGRHRARVNKIDHKINTLFAQLLKILGIR